MPIKFAPEPRNGAQLVQSCLARLAGAGTNGPSVLRNVDPRSLSLEVPHAVYDIRADKIAAGDGLETAELTGYRYLILSSIGSIAAAEVQVEQSGGAVLVPNINYGPFVDATTDALDRLKNRDEIANASFEARLLRIAAIFVVGIWLKADDDSLSMVYPLAPAPPVVKTEVFYSTSDFVSLVRPLARAKMAPRTPGIVP